MKIIRTHDKLYLKENRYNKPKEMFKFIEKRAIKKNLINKKICDFGCAAGEFLFYLNKKKPENEYTGIDIRQDLLKKAKQYIPDATFKRGSVLNKKINKKNFFDISFLIGVHPIFDDFEKCFSNLIYWTKPKGEIYICDMFNPDPIDVIIKYRLSENQKKNTFESGWNIFSKKSVVNFLKKNEKVKSYKFEEFIMPFHLKRQKDPVRSWTVDMNKKKIMVNGLSIIQPQTLLKIKLK
jgi:trans-aconitate methyltransferase